ncbi:hypothetical protein HYALB_00005948 [Hymenoscyphus albidus]|uniref:Uncharacterized protein n=1 Tax=Hymenoscyphus albidus TaxID=595503 RepID=A0A9N9LA06_9HELO|nr:hypothetical protein HYALB_00005948 [Hymenoscyphus albidus]
MYTSIPFASLLLTATLSLPTILAHPTTTPSPTLTPRSQTCSIFVQRWKSNGFDVEYFSAPLLPDHTGDNQHVLWNQENLYQDTSVPGSQLADYTLGGKVLHITNVANPVEGDPKDAGKLSFVYGEVRWDSFSGGTPCFSMPRPVETPAGFHAVACEFACDL